MRLLRTALRLAIVLYIVLSLIGLAQFVGSMFGWSQAQIDPSGSAHATVMGLPWSLGLGLLLHPNAGLGFFILAGSMWLNLCLLISLLKCLQRHLG
jgi:hypothetical protein